MPEVPGRPDIETEPLVETQIIVTVYLDGDGSRHVQVAVGEDNKTDLFGMIGALETAKLILFNKRAA